MKFQFFSRDLAVDLGTSNVLIYVDGKGVTVREPSVVAMDKNTGRILDVGSGARNMLGRTPGNVVAMRPLQPQGNHQQPAHQLLYSQAPCGHLCTQRCYRD